MGVASVVQGSYFIAKYRLNHGDAPHPVSPSRGMVALSSNICNNTTSPKDNDELPLRILVVGDSLAAGCGIIKSSTPILPESIAMELARKLGRTVQWSCVGKPGASAKGIVAILHKWFSNEESSFKEDEIDNIEYDVVVVLAGMNDMKDTLLPFMAYEGTELTFGDGLKNIYGMLREKLRLHRKYGEDHSHIRPLVVLPALPINAIPLLSYPPIGLIANSVIKYIDSAKQKLSRENPNNILFVEAPSESLIQNVENGKSKLCDTNLNSERSLLARHHIKSDVRQKIESLMREHSMMFERQDDCEAEVECDQTVYSHLRPEIRELGSSLISYDSIHPNERGYDYWGRHIAAAIIDEWKAESAE